MTDKYFTRCVKDHPQDEMPSCAVISGFSCNQTPTATLRFITISVIGIVIWISLPIVIVSVIIIAIIVVLIISLIIKG